MPDQQSKQIKSVIIVEDHHEASEVLKRVVLEAFDQPTVSTAASVRGGNSLLAAQSYDIALLDIGLPDGNGIELVKVIARHHPETLPIVTTIFDDESHLFEALKAGAGGYLIKGHSPDELKQFLIEAVSGRPALSPGIAISMLNFFRSGERSESIETEQETLTERETEILRLIAKGCQVKEVSRLLEITSNTVSHHIKSIYAKLNVHNRAEATAAAIQFNLYSPD